MAKKAKQAEQIKTLWETLGVSEDRKPASQTAQPDVAALQALIEQQGRQLAELTGKKDLPMMGPAPDGSRQQITVDPGKTTISMDGMPNREEDPDGYYREYTTRVNAAILAQNRATEQKLTQQFEDQRAADRLWSGFKSAYPKWAEYESLVETVTNRVATDLQNKGVDLQRLIRGSPEKFYAEIEGALKQQYGKLVADAPAAGEGSDEGEEEPFLDPEDPALVEGVGGAGSRQATKGATKPTGEVKPPDMFDDLRAIQKRMGVI